MTSMLDALKKIAAKPVSTTPQDVSSDVVSAALQPPPIDVPLNGRNPASLVETGVADVQEATGGPVTETALATAQMVGNELRNGNIPGNEDHAVSPLAADANDINEDDANDDVAAEWPADNYEAEADEAKRYEAEANEADLYEAGADDAEVDEAEGYEAEGYEAEEFESDEFEAEPRRVEQPPSATEGTIEARLEDAAEQVEELSELFEESGERLHDELSVNEAAGHDELETLDEESTTHERSLAAGESEEQVAGQPSASGSWEIDETDSSGSDADPAAAGPDEATAGQRHIGSIPRLYLNSPMRKIKLDPSLSDSSKSFADRLIEIDANGGIGVPASAASSEPPVQEQPDQDLHPQEGRGADTPLDESTEPAANDTTVADETPEAVEFELPANGEPDVDRASFANQVEDTPSGAVALEGAEFVTRLSSDKPGVDSQIAEIAQFAFATSTDTNHECAASANGLLTAQPTATAVPESHPDDSAEPDELSSVSVMDGMAIKPVNPAGIAEGVASIPLERVVEEPIVPQKSKRDRKPTPFEDEIRTLMFDPVVGTQIAELFENIEKECDQHGSFVLISTQFESHVSQLIGCMALVHALGNKRNVLLVDGNCDKPSLSAGFSLEQAAGFSDACSGRRHWQSVVQPTATAGLSIVPAGAPPEELSDRSDVITILREMADAYDTVMVDGGIIDSPFTLPLCHAADRVYLLVRLGKTPRNLAEAAFDNLRGNGIEINGTVVTNVPVTETS